MILGITWRAAATRLAMLGVRRRIAQLGSSKRTGRPDAETRRFAA